MMGSNSMIPDDRAVLYLHHLSTLEEIEDRRKEVNEERKKARRLAKADGFELGDEIDFGLRIRAAENSETVSASLRRRLQAAAMLSLPVDYQMDMFREPSDDPAQRAFASGLTAGIEGKDPKPPEEYSGEFSSPWMEGWHKGQARLAEAMQRRMETANAEAEEKPKRGRKAKDKEGNGGIDADEEDVRPRFKQTDEVGEHVAF